jgi:hypothetical protein
MDKNYRYTILVFPQNVVGNKLFFNIVFLPRNRDPFVPMDTEIAGTTTTPFAQLVPRFEAKIVKGLEEFPVDSGNPNPPIPKNLIVEEATKKEALLKATEISFGGKINNTPGDKAEAPKMESRSVKKYLPLSYRNAFNFTTPRHKNAVTDDSYHCAIRDNKPNTILPPTNLLSWGKAFGYIMRQPMLAKACGFVYSTSIDLEDDWFEKGGYLYVDLANPDHVAVQDASWTVPDEGSFVKRFAARIPKLKPGEKRTLFAPVLFPVLHKFGGTVTEPKAPWDSIFKEVNAYDDGFAKIIHSNQPVSLNLLKETHDGAHPVHDAGIRLGWDDEQLLIWYIRQIAENPDEPGKRIDTPLGLFGYRIDVRKSLADAWESLNTVVTNQVYKIGDVEVGNAVNEEMEMPYQVYPSQVDSQAGKEFWLPMYFTNWIGRSLVMKDDVAAKLYKHDNAKQKPIDGGKDTSVNPNQIFTEKIISFKLLYGKSYFFRVRLCDLSNGGPSINDEVSPLKQSPNPSEKVDFKRFIEPGKLRFSNLKNLLINTGDPMDIKTEKNHVDFYNETIVADEEVYDANPVVNVQRPTLGYPAVLFTGKYDEADAIAKLQAIADADADPDNAAATRVGLGIADPDVTKVEIIVEVETLKLDNLLSYTGQENYAHLYTTTRNFDAVDFEKMLDIPFTFIDAPNLNLINFDSDGSDPFNNPALLKNNLDARTDVVVPTARKIRITMRAVCEEDDVYFGSINGNKEKQTRFGAITQIFLYKESVVEDILIQPWKTVPIVQGVYLQPDEPIVKLGIIQDLFNRHGTSNKPNIVQRLAKQIGIDSNGLTLVSNKGERIVFGCSNKIRHSLAPDLSALTFASKEDLADHWLGCVVYKLNRDWSWDALEDVAFTFERKKKFKADDEVEHQLYLGDIEMKSAVSFEALQADRFGNINRNETILVFIDAIEPKAGLLKLDGSGELRFPDEQEVEYIVKAKFKKDHGNNPALMQPQLLTLPTTVNPAQVPKLASVGLAFSPYIVNGNYESTETRQRYLWVELTEPIKDPNDTLYCRKLAYAPDQLISNNDFELFAAPEEPPLPIDSEYIRVITPNQSDDLAGLSAMQVLTKSSDSDVHYLMPIPPGMHSESAELFGFFTYEFRVGHGHWPERESNLWSTAQGRFGRALKVTGMQHPAPNLLNVVNRDEERLYVNAPYAQAVFNGKNVTSNPPRTQLWCLLYAQVHQADGKAFRNILLDDKYMDWKRKRFATVDAQKAVLKTYRSFLQREKNIDFREFNLNPAAVIDKATISAQISAGAALAIFKDQPRIGTAEWTNKEIFALLQRYGLPEDSDLSVLTVEVFGNITNIREHLTKLFEPRQQKATHGFMAKNMDEPAANMLKEHLARAGEQQAESFLNTVQLKPLSSGLGHYRILRSSPLTVVPFVCCTE